MRSVIFSLLCVTTFAVEARTRLVMVPQRELARIDLNHPQQALVEEERTLTLQQGINQVEFAYSGVAANAASIQLRPIKTPAEVRILSVSYPPGENALFWEVFSEKAGPAVFRISYLVAHLPRSTAYEATVNREEKTLNWRAFHIVQNASGENFASARLESSIGESHETSLQQGEAKKILAFTAPAVRFTKKYLFDAQKSQHVSLVYELTNDRNSGMPELLLPHGKARIYQEDPQGSEAFLGEDWVRECGAGQKLELNLGQAKEVKVSRSVLEQREEIVRLPVKNIYQKIRYQLENFKDVPVSLTLQEHPGREWEILATEVKEESGERSERAERDTTAEIRTERIDTDNLRLHIIVPPNGQKKLKLNLYLKLVLKNRW
ncbi:MAG: hypothetical protein N2Z22_04150 [Turneriella sp.]|nr:hypothetical protein [Turneriella sp.]